MDNSLTIRSTLRWAHGHLRQQNVGEARLAAEMLLAHVLDWDRFDLYLKPDHALEPSQMETFRSFVEQRAIGVPVQQLIGHVSFMGYPLKVNRSVLIPRFETEELVQRALNRLSAASSAHFLDAGTGSGAIAIALAQERPGAHGTASDCSVAALEVARQNARDNGVDDRVRFVHSDWFEQIAGQFDLLISNPPYVPTGEIERLASEVKHHDPRLALDGGPDGLAAIGTLITRAPHHLKPLGWLLLEVGAGQAEAVQSQLKDMGYVNISVYADISGMDRIVEAQWEG